MAITDYELPKYFTVTRVGMMIVSVTPNVQVAFILGSFATSTMNLFFGYYLEVPVKNAELVGLAMLLIPKSWLLNVIIVLQYRDIDKEIQAFGEIMTVYSFIEDYFGYHHKYLVQLVVVLIIFPIALASLFTFFTGTAAIATPATPRRDGLAFVCLYSSGVTSMLVLLRNHLHDFHGANKHFPCMTTAPRRSQQPGAPAGVIDMVHLMEEGAETLHATGKV
ncbi:hypothetical protein F3Y22_tig00001731pilonHSYRG00057 [Hibiscus syriacus]|uniref:Uncharacterized protein n=1 Tax=Hibiscus syriacus TaxID=106335 RepID=A0A6A3D0B9_HIBSY|nr:hypothetical protein F3Y22_tig00001731pilonHSYRG00057 [Hibiscus syriacus]